MVTPGSRSILLHGQPRSRLLGLVVAAASVAATTGVIFALRQITPAVSNGVLYLLAVLLASTYWGMWLGLLTSVASALAFNWFHIPPTGRFTVDTPENWVALGVFLATAVVASRVADLARARAEEAERRRAEADLATEAARLLLGETTADEALGLVGHRLAEALALPSATIALGDVHPDERRIAVALDVGRDRAASLVVPASIAPEELARVRDHVAPALEALIAAALDREALLGEVVETRALRRSDVIKTAVLRAVSHDLRTPLTAIVAAGAAVRSPTLTPTERDELADAITQEADRLARLVDKLLDLSRLQAGTAEPRRDWCSIEEIVRSAVDDLGVEGAPFELSIDADLPLVQADAVQLERAIANLLENARRFSAPHPVQVRARRVNERILMRIVDRGPGIPQPELARVFEAFYRGERRPGGHGGSGLGLAIARGFVEANGGRVWAESLPGQGTTFVVELPVQPAPAEAARA